MPLTQGLHRAVQRHPEKTAFVSGGQRLGWLELRDRVARLAGALRQRGVAPGDRVALLAPNSGRYAEAVIAAWWLGAVAVPLNTRWSSAELAYAIADCEPRLLFAAGPMWEAAAALGVPLLSLDEAGDDGAGGRWLADAQPVDDVHAGGDTLAAILYTGGTTGRAKGVMLSHANFWTTSVARMAEIANRADWVSLIVTPLFHVAGLGRLVSQIVTGATSVFLPGFNAVTVLDAIEQEQVNDMVLVPTMIQMLLDHPQFAASRLSSLRRLLYGASPIAAPLLDRAMRTLPGVDFMQAYGMTECAATVSSSGPENHSAAGIASGRVRSAGRAGWCNLIRIADADGQEVPRGTVGELLVQGPNVMLGYWRLPTETAQALRGGWYHSGDGAWMDDSGHIYIVDRLKDMIISGGENVYSVEVEAVLAAHPGVATCAVIGVPSAEWGEAVHAVVVPRPGAETDGDALRAYCRERLAGYKCPKTIEWRDALPLSAAGKVLKNALRNTHAAGRGTTAHPLPEVQR